MNIVALAFKKECFLKSTISFKAISKFYLKFKSKVFILGFKYFDSSRIKMKRALWATKQWETIDILSIGYFYELSALESYSSPNKVN